MMSNCYGVGERVIDIVEDQRASSEYYRINVFGSPSGHLLHVLSFEGCDEEESTAPRTGNVDLLSRGTWVFGGWVG